MNAADVVRSVVARMTLSEPAIIHAGRLWTAADLRALIATRQTDQAGDLAPAIPAYLEAVDQASANPAHQLIITEHVRSETCLPDGIEHVLPPGWELFALRIGYVEPLVP
jgi:hypothetical protein